MTTKNGSTADARSPEELAFQDLATAWRAAQPMPLDGLTARVRRRNRWSAIVIAVDIAVSVIGLAVLGWFLSTGPPPLWLVWVAFMAVTTIVLLTFSIHARSGTWRAERPGMLGLLELSIRQARSSIRLARGTWLGTLLVLAFTAGWATLEVWQLEDPTSRQIRIRTLGYGFTLLYLLGWLVGCRLWLRRKHQELAGLEESLAELGSSQDNVARIDRP